MNIFSNPSSWMIAIYGGAIAAIIIALTKALVRKMEASAAAKLAEQAAEAAARDAPALPPSMITALPESREGVIEERSKRGVCMYCDTLAQHHLPRLQVVRSVLDPILRYVGVKPLDRWRVVLWGGFDAPIVVCERHKEWVRGLLENKASELATKYAKFSVANQVEIAEFENHILHSEIRRDTLEMATKHTAVAPKRGRNVTLLSDVAPKKTGTGV